MKAALDGWLERVVYARNPEFNQANERIKDVLLDKPPQLATLPATITTHDQTLDSGRLEIIGTGAAANAKLAPGAHVDLHVYFKVHERTTTAYRFLLAVWPVDPATWKPTDAAPATMVRSNLRVTAEGFFASDRWRENETVRERFNVTIPAEWKGGIAVGLVAGDANGDKAIATGAAPANDPNLIVLGMLPLGSSGP
jgi:hypothetical protein